LEQLERRERRTPCETKRALVYTHASAPLFGSALQTWPCATTATGIVRACTRRFAAYWVGGCVRDRLLGREPEDFDIATSAVPEQIEAVFQRTIPVGRQFGVIIVLEDGGEFQVATFRAEADYQDGRHPEQVTFSNAQADASRRDFTGQRIVLRSGGGPTA